MKSIFKNQYSLPMRWLIVSNRHSTTRKSVVRICSKLRFRGAANGRWAIFDRSFREITKNGTQERKYLRILFKPPSKFNKIAKIERYNSTSTTVSSVSRIEKSKKCWWVDQKSFFAQNSGPEIGTDFRTKILYRTKIRASSKNFIFRKVQNLAVTH